MMNFIEAGDVITREAARLQTLMDAASALAQMGSMQQAAAEASTRRDTLQKEVDTLAERLAILTPQVADASGKADLILIAAEANAQQAYDKAVADGKAVADRYQSDAIAAAQLASQQSIDAANQAVVVAQDRLNTITQAVELANKEYTDAAAGIVKLAADKADLESTIAALKAKFQ